MNQTTDNKLKAVRLHIILRRLYGGDAVENITDALADLRHLCDYHDLDFATLDGAAYDHYTTEIRLPATTKDFVAHVPNLHPVG